MPSEHDFLFERGIFRELLNPGAAELLTPPPAPPVYEVRCCCRPCVLLGTLDIGFVVQTRYFVIPTRDFGVLQLELREMYMPGRGYYKAFQMHEDKLPLLRQCRAFKETS